MTKKTKYLAALSSNIVKVVFTKTDGTERTMICTLKEDYLPVREMVRGDKVTSEVKGDAVIDNRGNITSTDDTQPNTVKVWDIEASAWRSFRIDSVKELSVLNR